MKIPKKVKIGGHWWTVKWPHYFTENKSLYGQIDYALKEIRISIEDGAGNKRVIGDQIVSFIHELIHGVNDITASNLFKGDEAENIIIRVSECIYQVLVDNGWLKID